MQRLRPLNMPRRITVIANKDGRPITVTMGRREFTVDAHYETWRIDDEWWRRDRISRIYWRLSLGDGRVIDVYRDLVDDSWFRQSYR